MAAREDRCVVVGSRMSTLKELLTAKQRVVTLSRPWAFQQSAQRGFKSCIVFAVVKFWRRAFQRFQHDDCALPFYAKFLQVFFRQSVMGFEEGQRPTSMLFLTASIPRLRFAMDTPDICMEV